MKLFALSIAVFVSSSFAQANEWMFDFDFNQWSTPWSIISENSTLMSIDRPYCRAVTARDGNSAWENCENITDVNARNCCRGITSRDGNDAWANCNNIQNNDLKNYCRGITSRDGDNAWANCNNIQNEDLKNYCRGPSLRARVTTPG